MRRLVAVILLTVLFLALAPATPAHASCFNPPGNAGDHVYNGAYSTLEFCNGGAWISVGGPVGNTSTGLVGWWKLDDGAGTSAVDSSGNGNTGTLTNGPTWTTSGMNNGALTFVHASSQYVTVPDAASLQLAGSWTVATWVNPTAVPGSGVARKVVSKTDAAGNANYGIAISNNLNGCASLGWRIYFNPGGNSCYLMTINPGTWYHVVGEWDSVAQNLLIYVNGVLVVTQNVPGGLPSSDPGGPLDLGYQSGGGTAYLDGTLDDTRVYNRALSATDIMTLYTSTGGTSGDINTGLAGYWKFDEGSGTLAADSSINGNTGTLVASPTWTAGQINDALTFDGATQYVDVTSNPAALQITGSITLTAWVNAASITGVTQTVLAKNNQSTNNRSYALNLDPVNCGGNENFNMTTSPDGTAFAARCSNTVAVAGTWYFVATIYNAAAQTMDIYVNGVLDNRSLSGTVPASLYNSTADVNIGRKASNNNFFNGTIDDARIYNRALSPSDVLTLYNTYATACAGPVGYTGDLLYNAGTYHVPQYCNGTNWVPTGKVSPAGAGGGGCTSPAGGEGDMIYNGVSRVTQYCDGTTWRAMGGNIPITGLIHWWNLDEAPGATTAADSINAQNATLVNPAAFITGGKINNALTTGSGGYAYVTSTPADMLGQSHLTLSAWMKRSASGAQIQMGQETGGGSGNEISIQIYNDSNAYYCISGNASYGCYVAPMPNSDTNWHLYTLVFDGTQTGDTNRLNGYIDGVQQTLTKAFGSIPATTPTTTGLHFDLGATSDSEGADNGIIDDARVYNRTLSASEVWRLYK